MTPDELKSIPKGEFVVMKTGTHPMRTKLQLFLKWGITFEEPYVLPDQGKRQIFYASRQELEMSIAKAFASEQSIQTQKAAKQVGPRF